LTARTSAATSRPKLYRVRQRAGHPGEVGENGLRNFFGQLRRADLPERGGKDEVKVAADDFGEGVLGVMARLPGEQVPVGISFHKYIATVAQTGQRKLKRDDSGESFRDFQRLSDW
jgi:hypothetical protein